MGPGQVTQVVPIKLILEILEGEKKKKTTLTLYGFLYKPVVTGNIFYHCKERI